jgi:hypothetical protein
MAAINGMQRATEDHVLGVTGSPQKRAVQRVVGRVDRIGEAMQAAVGRPGLVFTVPRRGVYVRQGRLEI